MPSALRDAFVQLLQLPTLDSLILGSINSFHLSDLAKCSNLKHLNYSVHFDVEEHFYKNLGFPYISAACLADEDFVIDFSPLHHYEVYQTYGNLQRGARALFKQCRQLMEVHTCRMYLRHVSYQFTSNNLST